MGAGLSWLKILVVLLIEFWTHFCVIEVYAGMVSNSKGINSKGELALECNGEWRSFDENVEKEHDKKGDSGHVIRVFDSGFNFVKWRINKDSASSRVM